MSIFIINDKIKSEIVERWSIKSEFEVRIQKVSKSSFIKILDFFSDRNVSEPKISVSHIYEGNYRSITENNQTVLMRKTDIKTYVNPFLDIKFSLADEKIMDSIPTDVLLLKRERIRRSSKWGNFTVDMTEVKQYYPSSENYIEKYEIEIEYVGNNLIKDFNSRFITFLTQIIEIRDFIKEIYSFYNSTVSGMNYKNSKCIDSRYVSKPRDLTFNDLVGKGILKGYVAGIKASGKLKMLISYKEECWFSIHENEDIFLSKSTIIPDKTIIVGEYIEESGLFLVFDLLSYNGENVSKLNYLDRIKKLSPLLDNQLDMDTEIGIIHIKIKDYVYLGKSSETFFQGIGIILDLASKLKDYENDGLILTPNESGYITEGQGLKTTLASKMDVVKFKPIELLSIDLLYDQNKLYASPNNLIYDFNSVNDDKDVIFVLKEKFNYKDIIEFYPVKKNNKITYTSERIRTDKKYANSYKIYESHMRILADPILEDTIRGKNTKLMFKYHNRIKKNLYGNKRGVLIDFGCGKGGDISKWKNFSHIFGIEPNQDYLLEFRRRLNSEDFMKDKISLLNAGGEETEKIMDFIETNKEIIRGNNLYISFMLSLTFFWKDDKIMLKNLARSIKEIEKIYSSVGGKKITIIYFVLDGNKVRNLKGNTLTLKVGEKEVFIDISDSSIVHNQTEYRVFLKDLWKLIRYDVEYEEQANKEELLNKTEKEYSDMFIYGEAIKHIENEDFTTKKLLNEIQFYQDKVLGDDKIENIDYLHENLYRMAVIPDKYTYQHSLSKLLLEDYRNNQNYEKRRLIAEHYDDINRDIGIIIFKGDEVEEIINDLSDEFVFLNKNEDDTYEPIIYVQDDEYFYSFDRKSVLLNNILEK